MTDKLAAQLLEETALSLEEVATSCRVEVDWVIARVRDRVLTGPPDPDPARWAFSGTDLLRLRRIVALERDFDADPMLAAMVVDLIEELARLRARLRGAGLDPD
ncbi:MAG: MerR family transcriptional regulator [Porticoccaceae bacterium]|nr:MerR family transcriptional regulator [Porticoccaceae bacterium]